MWEKRWKDACMYEEMKTEPLSMDG